LGISENEWLEMRAVMVDGPYAVLHTENGRLVSKRLQREWRAACEKSEKAKASRSQRQSDQKSTNVPTNVVRSSNERTHERTHERTTSHQSSVISQEKERESAREQSLVDDYPVLRPLAEVLAPWERELGKRTADRDCIIQCLTVHHMDPALVRMAFDQGANAGASSVAYVAKCLRDWQKKGWHTVADKEPEITLPRNRGSTAAPTSYREYEPTAESAAQVAALYRQNGQNGQKEEVL
jgi:hypothetical protein